MRRAVGSFLVLFLLACGDDAVPRIEYVSQGKGPANAQPLDSFVGGQVSSLGSGKGRIVGAPFLHQGRELVRVTYEDPSIPVEYVSRSGLRLGTSETGFTKHPTLLVPEAVRAGMKWHVRTGDGDEVSSTFEVLGRKVMQSPFGEIPVWHIRESGDMNIHRVYLEGYGLIGTGTLADVSDFWRYESAYGGEALPQEPEAPLLALEGPGVPWTHQGDAPRFLHGASFRLSEGGWSGLYLEGRCGEEICSACLAVEPDGTTHTVGGPGCPARHAGRVAVVSDEGGPSFVAAEDAEVVFVDPDGVARALRWKAVGMEARPVEGGAPWLLSGGWDPLHGTQLDEDLRWSVGSTVYLAGRTALARSVVGESHVSPPELIGGFDGRLHGSVGPQGHTVLLTTEEGAIGRLGSVGHQPLGVVDLPKGHRLVGAWEVGAERAVVATVDREGGTWLWPIGLSAVGPVVEYTPALGHVGRMDGDDAFVCAVGKEPCVLALGSRHVEVGGRSFLVREGDGSSDAFALHEGAAPLADGFVSRTHLLLPSGISQGAPRGALSQGLGEGGVPDLAGGGLWVPQVEFQGEGLAGLVRLGKEPHHVVLARGAVEGHPKLLFPGQGGGVVAEVEGQRTFVPAEGEPVPLSRPAVDGVYVKLRGWSLGGELCGTYQRPLAADPQRYTTFLFCDGAGGVRTSEVGADVELLPLEGEAWTSIGGTFLAVRQEGEKRQLVQIRTEPSLEVAPYPLQLGFDPGRKRSYPAALHHDAEGRLWGVHLDVDGTEVVGRFDPQGFLPLTVQVEGARRIRSVHPGSEYVFVRAVLGETCDDSGCVEDERIVRFPGEVVR